MRIVVCGGKSTGKSSLIAATAAGVFQANLPPVLPPITLPEDFSSDYVSVTIIDTSSRSMSLTKFVSANSSDICYQIDLNFLLFCFGA